MSLRFIFMLMYTPTAMAVSVWRPFWGLLMLVFLYYFRPDIWNAPTWFRPILWITIAVGIGWAIRARHVRIHPLMSMSLLVLLGITMGAFTAAADKDVVLDGSWTITKLLIVQFLTMQLVDTPQKVNQFLWANIAGMIWNVKTILVVGAGGGDLERVNVNVGQGGGANYLAMILIMGLPFFFIRLQNGSRYEKRAILLMSPLYMIATVFTGSRAGVLALAAIMVYLITKSRRKFVGFVTVAVAATILIMFMPAKEWDRFRQGMGPEEERDFSAQSRILLWKAGWTMFRESPLLGKGMDNFPLISYFPQYTGFYAGKSARPYTPGSTGTGFVAHSTWFQTLGEGGILVSLPFFLLFPMAFYALWKVSRIRFPGAEKRWYDSHCIAMTGLWIAFVIASTFGSHIKLDFLWWYMGLTSAIALNARERLAREHVQRRQAVIDAQREAWERDVGLAPARLDQPVRY